MTTLNKLGALAYQAVQNPWVSRICLAGAVGGAAYALSSFVPLQILAVGAIGICAITAFSTAGKYYWDSRSIQRNPLEQVPAETVRRVLVRVPQQKTQSS